MSSMINAYLKADMMKKIILIVLSMVLMGCLSREQIYEQKYGNDRPEQISVNDELEVYAYNVLIGEKSAIKLEIVPQYRAEFIEKLNELYRLSYEIRVKEAGLIVLISYPLDYKYDIVCFLNGKKMPGEFCLFDTRFVGGGMDTCVLEARKYIKASSWAKLKK